MKVLVTGASGFLGAHLVDALDAAGHEVHCFLRNSAALTRLKARGIACVQGDLANRAALNQAVLGVDAIIHCAGLTKARDQAEYDAVNAQGTLNILAAAAKVNPTLNRFILISSLAAQGPNAAQPANPISQYGRSKLRAEQYAKQFSAKFPIIIFRPPVIYGPGDLAMLPLFKLLQKGFVPLANHGKLQLSVIYIADAVTAIIKALTVPTASSTTYYLEDGSVYPLVDLLTSLAKVVTARKPWFFPLPLPLLKLLANASETLARLNGSIPALTRDKALEMSQLAWVCDASLTRSRLAWHPEITWTQGIQLTYNWYQKMDFL